MPFSDLNRQLSGEVVAMFRHKEPLFYCAGDRFFPFDAIKEPFDVEIVQTSGKTLKKTGVGFQVVGDVWKAIDAATHDQKRRFIVERIGDTLNRYQIDRNTPVSEITSDREAIRINTVLVKEKEILPDDFTERIVRDPA